MTARRIQERQAAVNSEVQKGHSRLHKPGHLYPLERCIIEFTLYAMQKIASLAYRVSSIS